MPEKMKNNRMDWFKWWHGTVTDPKFKWVAKKSNCRLSDVLAIWAALLEHASSITEHSQNEEETLHVTPMKHDVTPCNAMKRGNVTLFQYEDFDIHFDLEDGTTKKIISSMEEKGLIENGIICNFEKRQENPKSAVAIRVQRHRDSKKNVTCNTDVTPTKRNVTDVTTREDKIREDKNIDISVPNGTLAQPEQKKTSSRFEEFWKVYPRKTSRKKAEKIWNRDKLDARADEIITDAANRQAKHLPWRDKQFIPYPTTYLNGELWQDEIQEAQQNVDFELHEKIKQAYREILEPLDHSCPLNQWTSEDAANLQARINQNHDYQTETAWRDFFTHLTTLKKLTGLQYMPSGKPFKLSLAYIVREKAFADICNGIWDND